LNDVPVDVLAQRLLTAGGDLYKNLHDGRLELRARCGCGLALTDRQATASAG